LIVLQKEDYHYKYIKSALLFTESFLCKKYTNLKYNSLW